MPVFLTDLLMAIAIDLTLCSYLSPLTCLLCPLFFPPVYEEVQHEVTSVDDKNNPLRASFHTDVSLLQRIDSLRYDAQTLESLKESLQPMIDNSNFRSQFEDVCGVS